MHLSKTQNHILSLVLTVALLCSVVGIGFYSVKAAENGGYRTSDLEVRQDADDGWYAYLKGTSIKASHYYGVVSNNLGWWRIENGKVNFKANGVFRNDYGYWVVHGGKVDFNYHGFLQLDHTVHPKYGSPIYSNSKGKTVRTPKGKSTFWYLKQGCVQTGYSGSGYGTIKGRTGHWRVVNGRADTTYTGLAKNENGWWYFRNGTVDFKKTGVERNSFGWWRVENGKVNFNYNGVASNEYGSWYIHDGKVDFSYNGACLLGNTQYVIKNGKVVITSKITVGKLPVLRPSVVYTDTGAELSWTAPKLFGRTTIDGYEIYVKDSPTAKYTKVGTVDRKTTTFKHELGRSYADPGQTTRLYDVRAITKNLYGIVTASSPERKANAANNFVGGAYQLAAPDIVSVADDPSGYKVTFKNVPYAMKYIIYVADKEPEKPVNLQEVTSVNAENSGAGSAASANIGYRSANQTVTVSRQSPGYRRVSDANYLTVKAISSEKADAGYPAVTLESSYDTGFRLGQKQLAGKKILFMGDSLMIGTPYGPTTMDYTISTRVAQQTGASVYNAAVGGAVLVSDSARLINNSIYHNQNVKICDGSHENFKNGTWRDVKNMTDFDIVVLEGGPNDYYGRVPLGKPDSKDKRQFYGAMNQHMSLLKKASQNRKAMEKSRLKVVLVDIFYAPDGDKPNLANLKYSDYRKALKTIADAYADDPDIDVYWYTGTDNIVNRNNFHYCTVDNVHMTAYYYGQLGNHMSRFLLEKLNDLENADEVKQIAKTIS